MGNYSSLLYLVLAPEKINHNSNDDDDNNNYNNYNNYNNNTVTKETEGYWNRDPYCGLAKNCHSLFC